MDDIGNGVSIHLDLFRSVLNDNSIENTCQRGNPLKEMTIRGKEMSRLPC